MSTGKELNNALDEAKVLRFDEQPTQLRRCLRCDEWMHSTGADHRICNSCKYVYTTNEHKAGRRLCR